MILDSSAIVSIALREPGWDRLFGKLAAAPKVGLGAPSLVETAIVLSARLGRDARGLLARFLAEGSVTTIPFGDAHYGAAAEAWLRYGKGRHAAALNFGDCLAYSVARLAREPLLFTGTGFAQTDIEVA